MSGQVTLWRESSSKGVRETLKIFNPSNSFALGFFFKLPLLYLLQADPFMLIALISSDQSALLAGWKISSVTRRGKYVGGGTLSNSPGPKPLPLGMWKRFKYFKRESENTVQDLHSEPARAVAADDNSGSSCGVVSEGVLSFSAGTSASASAEGHFVS